MKLSSKTRWAVLFALAAAVGCSSSSPTSPGGVPGNLPPATGAGPTPKTDAAAEKLTLKGQVVDARTGSALSKATVVAYRVAELKPDAPPAAAAPTGGATDSATESAAAATPEPAPARQAERPRPKGSAPPPVKTTADDKGNFELPNLPPGTYAVTAYQKGYVAVSYVSGRPASGRLDVALPPQGDEGVGYEIEGKVLNLSKTKGAEGVMVGAALPPGLFAGTPAVSQSDGAFTLADLPAGKLLLAAWTLGDAGELRTWGIQREVKVAEGKDKKSSSPQITLRAISRQVVLAGKVAAPTKAIKPRQVQVLLATEDGTEVPLLTRTPDKDGHFRFGLPAPEEGTTYHLVASGVDSAGNAVYAHMHKIAGPGHAFDLQLPGLPATPSLYTEPVPEWTWTAEPDVSAYRVRLETTGDDAKTIWEGWTTGTSIALPQVGGLALKHGEGYRFTLSAVRAQGAFEMTEIAVTPWAAAASLAPKEFVAGQPFKNEPVAVAPAPVRAPAARAPAAAPAAAEPAPAKGGARAEPDGPPQPPKVFIPTPAPTAAPAAILPTPPLDAREPWRNQRDFQPGKPPSGDGPMQGRGRTGPAPPAVPQQPAPTRTPINL
ncbi:MAG: hypothetical protein FJZ01_08305 [Candidatus Sericytochromatia bacterium]|nr:hypothetical protein [Candidatus Tanganyikabacteria bacterium]